MAKFSASAKADPTLRARMEATRPGSKPTGIEVDQAMERKITLGARLSNKRSISDLKMRSRRTLTTKMTTSIRPAK